jgi:hypothetical protein
MRLCNYNYNLIYLGLMRAIKINAEEIEIWGEMPLTIYSSLSTEHNEADSQTYLFITRYTKREMFKFSLSLFNRKNFGNIYVLDSKMSRLELNFPR